MTSLNWCWHEIEEKQSRLTDRDALRRAINFAAANAHYGSESMFSRANQAGRLLFAGFQPVTRNTLNGVCGLSPQPICAVLPGAICGKKTVSSAISCPRAERAGRIFLQRPGSPNHNALVQLPNASSPTAVNPSLFSLLPRLFFFAWSLANADVDPSQKVDKWQTAKGTQVIFHSPISSPPIVDIHIAFAAGKSIEGGRGGLARLTLSGLVENSGRALFRTLESEGSRLDTRLSQDAATLQLRTLSSGDHLERSARALGSALARPQYQTEDIERGARTNSHRVA